VEVSFYLPIVEVIKPARAAAAAPRLPAPDKPPSIDLPAPAAAPFDALPPIAASDLERGAPPNKDAEPSLPRASALNRSSCSPISSSSAFFCLMSIATSWADGFGAFGFFILFSPDTCTTGTVSR
jgi:hypothetical protein